MTGGHPEAPQAASTTAKRPKPRAPPPSPPSREHHRQARAASATAKPPQAASTTVKSDPSPISTASAQNVKRSAHRTNTSNEGDRPAPTGPFDYPITLKTTLL